MEETAFEWELTNYPLMQATVDKLNPFLNLYETSMEFMNKQKTWFESPMGTHDPKVMLGIKKNMRHFTSSPMLYYCSNH